MQLGIAAGQPTAVGRRVRRLVRERREGQDRRPRRPPGHDQMRIDEGEGRVAGERDPHPRRRHGRGRRRIGHGTGSGGRHHRVEVAMGGDHAPGLVEPRGEARGLLGLDEAQMPLRQLDPGGARQRPEDGDAGLVEARAAERLVPGRGDAVQHHAGQPHPGAEAGEAARHRGGGLRLAGAVDHQHHRPAHQRGDVGAGAGAGLAGARHAVEKSHRALGDDQVGRLSGTGERGDLPRRHRPGIEVDRIPARGGGVEGRVDIVRPAFARSHGQAPRPQCRQQPERQRRLAGAGGRGRDHQPRGHAPPSGKRGAVPTGR